MANESSGDGCLTIIMLFALFGLTVRTCTMHEKMDKVQDRIETILQRQIENQDRVLKSSDSLLMKVDSLEKILKRRIKTNQ